MSSNVRWVGDRRRGDGRSNHRAIATLGRIATLALGLLLLLSVVIVGRGLPPHAPQGLIGLGVGAQTATPEQLTESAGRCPRGRDSRKAARATASR